MATDPKELGVERERAPRWFIPLGILLILLGAAGLLMTGFLTLGSVLAFGILLLVGGGVQIVQAFSCRGWRSMLPHAGIALLYIAAGLVILFDPVGSTLALTLLLGLFILAGGILRLIIGFQAREQAHWGWIVLSGALGIGLGGLILYQWPTGSFWIIGLFLAIEILFQGWSAVLIGLGFREPHPLHPETESQEQDY